MPAYCMVHVNVHNVEEYKKYVTLAGSAVAKYGGKFLVRGGRFVQKEGVAFARNVLVQFDDFETAEKFYDSPEYKEALSFALADGVSERCYCIVDGI